MEANQQPVCEAFIMTGESMLKLSRNETDINASMSNHNHHAISMSQNHIDQHHHTNNNNNNNTAAISTNNLNVASTNHNNNNTRNGSRRTICGPSESKHGDDRQQTGRRSPIEFKSGPLDRKSVLEARGKPTGRGRRGWRRVFVTLKDLRLIIRASDPEPQQTPQHSASQSDSNNGASGAEGKLVPVKTSQDLSAKIRRLMIAQSTPNNIKLHHSFAKRADHYTKREHVFRLRLADQSESLMQASSEHEMDSWIEMINFASACLSAPALPSAISSNGKRYIQCRQRTILPTSHTKLTYWEQLIDHEERLQRLKQDLEEHLNEAPAAKGADKRSKSDFIERIANLRQEIERYAAYVELMRKRSNSAEAIILSKHPQNAPMAATSPVGAPSKSNQ